MTPRRWIPGPKIDVPAIDTSTLFPPGDVAMGSTVVHVTNTRDTVRGSHFRVETPRKGGADVRLDFKTGRIACTRCGLLDCIHADAVRKYIAAQQPIDTGDTGANHGTNPRPF